MKPQLLIRASMQDHLVVADLLSPGAGRRLPWAQPPISQLVADAQVAAARPALAQAAQAAGVPFLIDPVTPLLQSDVDPGDRWAKLPFGVAPMRRPGDIELNQLVQSVVQFEVEQGATVIIPPYVYSTAPGDPWSRLNLNLIAATRQYMDRGGIRLPMMPVLCLQLRSFSHPDSYSAGIDRHMSVVTEHGAHSMALCVSPTGASTDHYAKVLGMFQLAQRAATWDLPVFAWHQGVYGLGLTAAGLTGYETGIGTAEQSDVAGQQAARKPNANDAARKGGSAGGVYLDTIGRSVPRPVANSLLGHLAMRPKVMCDVETCCPTVADTLDRSRPHAVRSRARTLSELAEQPHRPWRLNYVSRTAASAATLLEQANKVLAADGLRKITNTNLRALHDVCAFLAQNEKRRSA